MDRPSKDVRHAIANLQAVAGDDFRLVMSWINDNYKAQSEANNQTYENTELRQGQGRAQVWDFIGKEVESNDKALEQYRNNRRPK